MTDHHDFDMAQVSADKALTAMHRHNIPPTPRNFAVWYEYFSGTHPELKKAIDILLSNSCEFSSGLSDEIYEQFFGTDEQDRALREATAKIQETLGQVLQWLDEAGDGAKHYGEKLQTLTGKLHQETSGNTLAALLQRILVETQAMARRNSRLETRLQSSSQQIYALRKNLEDVRREALMDVLTGIANRKYFDLRLRECTADAMEIGEPLCLVLADIDHFKVFNDTWGHQFGDQVLKLVARALTDGVKGQDLPARFGGEEFAIILPRTRLADAMIVADKIRRDVAGRKLVKRATGAAVGRVTLSFGVAQFEPGEPLAALVRRADQALYCAKRNGRNCIASEEAIAEPISRPA